MNGGGSSRARSIYIGMTTIKEVAEKAGASVTAVSLSLNHRENGHVKKEVAQRIRRTAKELGYRPNPLARSLRTSRTRTIGFISEEIATTPYAGKMILGAQDAASELGYMMLLVNTDGKGKETDEIAALKRYGTDGFLYAKMYDRISSVPEDLTGCPTVLLDATDGRGKDGVPFIVPDEVAIGYDATMYLIRAGCRRIAYVGCSEPLIAEPLRRKGYVKRTKGCGARARPVAVDPGAQQPTGPEGRRAPVRRCAPRRILLFQRRARLVCLRSGRTSGTDRRSRHFRGRSGQQPHHFRNLRPTTHHHRTSAL